MNTLLYIENTEICATIDLTGAQLSSLKRLDQAYEYIWQRDSRYWSDSAPNLFPIVGHLKNGNYSYQGKTYLMPKHGIVRHKNFQVSEVKQSQCSVFYRSNDESKKLYPFDFMLSYTFQLIENTLRISFEIVNTGHSPMPVGIGFHPAFSLDIENYELNDYKIIFEKRENKDLYGLINGNLALREKDYLKNEKEITLSDSIFDKDALIFKNIDSQKITLQRHHSDWKVEVHTGGAPHLGIWAKPKAPFVCIEPWYVYADEENATPNLFDKPDMRTLMAGERWQGFYSIRV